MLNRMFVRYSLSFILILQSPFLGSCAGNFYKGLANTTTDEALFEAAKIDVNNANYAGAISKITTQMSSGYQAKREVKEFLVGAYAAKCGFDFFGVFNNLGSSGSIMKNLMNTYTAATPSLADCDSAEAIINSLSLTTDNKIFLAVYGLGKMGMILRVSEDADQDGVVDSIPTACKAKIDAKLDDLIVAFGYVFTNLATLGSSAPSAIATLTAACPACTFTKPTSVAAQTFMREWIDNKNYGLGNCADDNLVTCCP